MMSIVWVLFWLGIGMILGVGLMCCLSIGAYDDIINGRK